MEFIKKLTQQLLEENATWNLGDCIPVVSPKEMKENGGGGGGGLGGQEGDSRRRNK